MMEPTPEYLWHDLHENQGNSSLASILANQVLQSMKTRDSAALEYAAIAQVTAVSAAKKSKNWPQAKSHLQRAIEVTRSHYPIGQTVPEAQLRSEDWDSVYGKDSAQIKCLRDILKLYQTLDIVTYSEPLKTMIGGTIHLLSNLRHEKGTRFGLVFSIEESDYQTAQEAFTHFLKNYGPDSPTHDPNQLLTVTSIMFGRALDRKDFSLALKCLLVCGIEVTKQPQLTPFSARELGKNGSASHKVRATKVRLLNMLLNYPVDRQLTQNINGLLQFRYVGLGDRISDIKTGERVG